jgi:ParB/RepB/Spo0J family partition protein
MSRDILLTLIDTDPEQPRKHFDRQALTELAASIAANGLAVPVLLRPVGERYVIVHGERRYRAVQSLGHEAITAEVRDISPDQARWLTLVENIQRSDLSPIEEAQAYRARLAEGLTQAELGERIGKSQSYISTKLRLLRLSEAIQAALSSGLITEGHAKQLLRVEDTPLQQSVFELVCEAGLSVKSTAEVIGIALNDPSFAAIVTTKRPELRRALEFAVWSAAKLQGFPGAMAHIQAILDNPAATLEEVVQSVRVSGKYQSRAGEVHLRRARELTRLEQEIEAALYSLPEIGRAFRDVQALLSPEQFSGWLAQEGFTAAAAADFITLADSTPKKFSDIPDSILDFLQLPSHQPTPR